MPRIAATVVLSKEEQEQLQGLLRRRSAGQLEVLRARILLAAGAGEPSKGIAQRLQTREATVSKIRRRFLRERLAALHDAPRSGRKPKYDAQTEKRVLALLDKPRPKGYSRWNGRLVAERLGDVNPHHVWRILRRHGIQLERRRSWCVSTDPEFARKAADIVGLYLAPPRQAVVLAIDEKPHIQALERAQGWLRLPNGKALTGFTHEYIRHGTSTLFAALNIASGQIQAGHYRRRRREEFLDFMNQILRAYPEGEIHVVLDNLSTHKPKEDRWLASHRRVHFHFTPTHASWLNQIEIWFSILSRQALSATSFSSVTQLRQAIDDFITAYNPRAHPFLWTKKKVRQTQFKLKYADFDK